MFCIIDSQSWSNVMLYLRREIASITETLCQSQSFLQSHVSARKFKMICLGGGGCEESLVTGLSHGEVEISSDGGHVRYFCNHQHHLKGQSQLHCNGTHWSGLRPSCRGKRMMTSLWPNLGNLTNWNISCLRSLWATICNFVIKLSPDGDRRWFFSGSDKTGVN